MTDRERLIQILTCCTDTGCNNCPNKKDGHLVCKDYSARIPVHIPYHVAQEVIALLRDQSEIVRCKDCKHRDPEDGMCDSGHGIRWSLPRPDDWFCADGRRR